MTDNSETNCESSYDPSQHHQIPQHESPGNHRKRTDRTVSSSSDELFSGRSINKEVKKVPAAKTITEAILKDQSVGPKSNGGKYENFCHRGEERRAEERRKERTEAILKDQKCCSKNFGFFGENRASSLFYT